MRPSRREPRGRLRRGLLSLTREKVTKERAQGAAAPWVSPGDALYGQLAQIIRRAELSMRTPRLALPPVVRH